MKFNPSARFYRNTCICTLLTILFISCLGMAGCKTESASINNQQKGVKQAFPVAIKDDLGRNVTLKLKPMRIVSAAPSHTEILFALGLGDRVVGVTTYCNYPSEALKREKIGGFSNPSLEKIISLKPDLVFVGNDQQQDLIQGLENVGIPVLAFTPASIDETMRTINLIGKAAGAEREAASLTGSLKKRINAVTAKVSKIPESQKVRVYYELWYEPIMSAGPHTLAGDLIAKAGGKSITADVREDYPEISEELILSRNPQVMINTYAHGYQDVPNQSKIAARPGWSELEFVKSARIYSLDSDLLDRSSPRVADALELMARTLYPELFANEAAGE